MQTRQPEFTQVDMELSFVDEDDVMDVNERLLQKIFKEVLDVDVELPIQRMTWQEAMDRFGQTSRIFVLAWSYMMFLRS